MHKITKLESSSNEEERSNTVKTPLLVPSGMSQIIKDKLKEFSRDMLSSPAKHAKKSPSKQTNELSFRLQEITEFSIKTVSNYQRIQSLDLRNNRLVELSNEVLMSLPELLKLQVDFNFIEYIIIPCMMPLSYFSA
jgi:Leucine-rich repeat (LRR) protein